MSEETQEKKTGKKVYSKETSVSDIEEYLLMNYVFRYNTIKCKPEYRKTGTQEPWRPLTRPDLCTIRSEMDYTGLKTSIDNIRNILESRTISEPVNPVHEYFNTLEPWDGLNHITKLATTIITHEEQMENWTNYLKKWLVAVVANALTETGCQNHTCLVLTGAQGMFKTTWLDNLCPKELSSYMFTGKIQPDNKDTMTYIAEFFLINIDDQLRQLNKKDENDLKNIITAPSVKYRRPYDPYITEYPRLASFCASVNGNTFLTDPTGSRRFLPFEVMEIHINEAKKININQVWAQAFALFKTGTFVYWFNEEETKKLHEHNRRHQVVSAEEQLILEFFRKPEQRSQATHFMQTAMIHAHLEMHTRQRLSEKKLGEALTKLEFEKWQRTDNKVTRWVWSVIKKDLTDVEAETKPTAEEQGSDLVQPQRLAGEKEKQEELF